MNKEALNVVVDNVFTQEEINLIYKAVQNNSGHEFISPHAQANTFIQLPDSILEKVTAKVRELSGNDKIIITEYCHSRYANVTSNCGKFHFKPSLFPHFDETFKEPRFTFDYQLKSNIDWPLVIAPDKKFVLKDNQALTFSGTHQIHWRDPLYFADDQFVEMLFFHCSDPEGETKTAELNERLNVEAIRYKHDFFANGGFTNDSD